MDRRVNVDFAVKFPREHSDTKLPYSEDTRDERVPLEWQGSPVFRTVHFVAAAWVLALLALGIGTYTFAVRYDRAVADAATGKALEQ